MIQKTAKIINSTPKLAMNTAANIPPKTLDSGGIILSQLMIRSDTRPASIRPPAAMITNFNLLFFIG
jgi:hypothetical protein